MTGRNGMRKHGNGLRSIGVLCCLLLLLPLATLSAETAGLEVGQVYRDDTGFLKIKLGG